MNIRTTNLETKHRIILNIESKLNKHLYPEMYQSLQEVIHRNTEITLGFADSSMPLITKGVVYCPGYVKPLAHLTRQTLPLHKEVAAAFAEFLAKYRKELNAFACFRNMLIKAVAIAANLTDISVLTTIPVKMFSDDTPESVSRFMTETVISEFKQKHSKSIELVQYYSTFIQMFGDIEPQEE